TRRHKSEYRSVIQFDMLEPKPLPETKVVYICAAMTRFVDCEDNRLAYRINVDAPIAIAEMAQDQGDWMVGKTEAKVIYLSSEAVERCLHTNYGQHKALAEIGLRAVCRPVIVRLSKVDDIEDCARFLASLADAEPGIYQWSSPTKTERKDAA